jgi:hypothetical protein
MVFVVFILRLSLPGGEFSYANEKNATSDTVENLKATIQTQEETIKQLQAEIKKQQEQIDKLTEKLPSPPHPVAQALRETWVFCAKRNVQVEDELVRVFFIDLQDVITFFDSDAELNAHRDLVVFLKTANLKKGTIEYYNGENKLFSITGGLTDAKTKKYY